MVNAGRVACITLPFLLTLASLGCVIVIFLAGWKQRNNTLDNLFFAKLDLTNLTLSNDASLVAAAGGSSALNGALQVAKQSLNMTDYYTIYLRGYCGWNGNDDYAYCSSPTSSFFFDPITIWGLNETGYNLDEVLPKTFTDGLEAYQKGSTAMFYLFAIALALNVATVVVSISALFSRWGSLFTTILADLATICTIGGAVTATVMFPILTEALNKELEKNYGVKTTVGTRGLALAWIAAAFAIGAGLFWSFTICCCSTRSPYKGVREDKRTKAEKTPYTYERVGSPYLGPRNDQNVPLSSFNVSNQGHSGYNSGPTGARNHTAYEPFRSQA